MKALSIPRLELLAAELSMNLYLELKRIHHLDDSCFRFYTDSKDVLYWLGSESKRLSRFVAHRISKIQDNTPIENWFHVRSKDNPADVGSRGRTAEELAKETMWWQGPPFLRELKHMESEKRKLEKLSEEARKEVKSEKGVTLTIQQKRGSLQLSPEDRLHPQNFSSLDRFIRVLALIRRGCRRWKSQALKKHEEDDESEEEGFEQAELEFLRFVQREALYEEMHSFSKRGVVSQNSKLAQYCPFLDKEGLFRVGGRLQHIKGWKFDNRCPIILPNNYSAQMMLRRIHTRDHLHALGAAALKARFAERYFTLGLTSMSRKICNECLPCRRILARPISRKEAPLPDFRVGKPGCREGLFQSVQIDVTGPFLVKNGSGKLEKKYALVIICHIYRAVHLELLTSLSSDSLLMGLQRFVNRRGGVTHIWSDNARGLVGGSIKLDDTLRNFRSDGVKVTWEFGAPNSPNHQGLVEATIRSLKRSIEAVIGERKLSSEELETATVTIEGLMNSRPIDFVEIREIERALTSGDMMGMNGLSCFSDFPFVRIKALGSRWIKLNKLLDQW